MSDIPAQSSSSHNAFDPISSIPENLVDPISALVRVASHLRLYIEALEAECSEHNSDFPAEFWKDSENQGINVRAVYDGILRQWRDHVGITVEDLADDADEGEGVSR